MGKTSSLAIVPVASAAMMVVESVDGMTMDMESNPKT
jgi:hypothetical protein